MIQSPLLPNTRDEDDRSQTPIASFTGAVFNLSTTTIGAGIMSLPAAMKVLGLVPGIAMIIVVAVLAEASMELLLRYSKAAEADSYGDVMRDSFGVFGERVFQSSVLVNNIGVLVVYMIIIADVLSGTSSNGVHHAGLLENWLGRHWWTNRTTVLVVTTLTVFSPLSCFKRIDSLRYTSGLAVGLAILFPVVTAGIAIAKLIEGNVAMPRLLPNFTGIASLWNLFTVVPILVTAFVCHFNLHTISNELNDSTLIQPVITTSLTLCSTIYILTSFFGFLLFGDSTLDDVLANFDTDLNIPLLADTVRITYVLHLMLVFPLIFFPLRVNLDDMFFASSRPLNSDNRRFALISIGLIFLIFALANFIPSIWDAFQFTGATAAVCIGFIFPSIIALKDPHGIATRKDKILSIVMISLAIFSNVVAIISDAYDHINN